MTSWFRSWHGAPTDTKWLLIARRAGVAPGIVSAIAWALLDYASQHADRGCVNGFDVETYAAFSGFDESDIQAIIDAMTAKQMIVSGRLASWEKRQPEREDNSTERVRRYRESRNGTGVTPEDVTHGNAMSRNETQCNAPDTDTDTDTEKRESVVSVVEGVAPQAARALKPAKSSKPAKAPPPPEIETVRTVTGRYPDKALWESIVTASAGKTADDVREAYTAWVGRGFKPTNYAWLLEWVPNGIPPAQIQSAVQRQVENEPKGFQGIRDYIAERGLIPRGI